MKQTNPRFPLLPNRIQGANLAPINDCRPCFKISVGVAAQAFFPTISPYPLPPLARLFPFSTPSVLLLLTRMYIGEMREKL